MNLVSLSRFLDIGNYNASPRVYIWGEVSLRIPRDMWSLLYFPSLSLERRPHWGTGATLLHSSRPWPWTRRFYCLWRFRKPEEESGPCVSWPQLSHSVLCWVLLGSHQDHLSEMHMGRKGHELAPRVWKEFWLLENFPRGSESFHFTWLKTLIILGTKSQRIIRTMEGVSNWSFVIVSWHKIANL